jgi:hypothetical protein
VLERLSIVATETLQALLNQKSKGCLKKHSLSLESQRPQIATHIPKKVGCSSPDTLSLLTKHPIALLIQGISMRILASPAEITPRHLQFGGVEKYDNQWQQWSCAVSKICICFQIHQISLFYSWMIKSRVLLMLT